MKKILFSLPVRVYYEDTDAGGVVYHANYLKFCERARTEWLRTLGYSQETLKEQLGLGFVARRISGEFLRPARLDDQLSVRLGLERLSRVRLLFVQEIVPASQPFPTACADEAQAHNDSPLHDAQPILFSATVEIASVSLDNMKPTALPPSIFSVLERLL